MVQISSPRLFKPRTLSIIDFRRPFSELDFISQFDSLRPLFLMFAQMRQLGCRSVVLEDIYSPEKPDEENQFIINRYPKYDFFSQKRLTFWKSSFSRVSDIETQTDRNFLGYVILKKDSVNQEKIKPKWHILEAVLRPPFGDNVFILQNISFKVRC